MPAALRFASRRKKHLPSGPTHPFRQSIHSSSSSSKSTGLFCRSFFFRSNLFPPSLPDFLARVRSSLFSLHLSLCFCLLFHCVILSLHVSLCHDSSFDAQSLLLFPSDSDCSWKHHQLPSFSPSHLVLRFTRTDIVYSRYHISLTIAYTRFLQKLRLPMTDRFPLSNHWPAGRALFPLITVVLDSLSLAPVVRQSREEEAFKMQSILMREDDEEEGRKEKSYQTILLPSSLASNSKKLTDCCTFFPLLSLLAAKISLQTSLWSEEREKGRKETCYLDAGSLKQVSFSLSMRKRGG